MKFNKIVIKNFRNFENIEVNLQNINVFFGMNDVGKTNFLYALRYLLDKNIRKSELVESDFYNRNIKNDIEILLKIDIFDDEDNPNQDNAKLRAKLKGAIKSADQFVYLKLVVNYDEIELMTVPVMYWGGDLNNLEIVKTKGYTFESDSIFNVVYIDSYVEVKKLFKNNVKSLMDETSEDDKDLINDIKQSVNNINSSISRLAGVKKLEEDLSNEYKHYFDEDLSIAIKSELEVKNIHSNMIPYIRTGEDELLYPTAGEGRKKLLTYSVYSLLANDSRDYKINILLLEEPENNLHKSMQIALSKILFTDSRFDYIFLTTHSSYILSEMNDVNLIRIYNDGNVIGKSYFYEVPMEYTKVKRLLNRFLSEAIFSRVTLLVEGPSEYYLFSKVLSVISPDYGVKGIYILPVNGITFEKYKRILEGLNIKVFIKTDNDFRQNKSSSEIELLGFSRCNNLIGQELLSKKEGRSNAITAKRHIYNKYKDKIDYLRTEHGIYLSKVDLENDLEQSITRARLSELTGKKSPVKFLQNSKHYNMIELIDGFTEADCRIIYMHENFRVLKAVVNAC